MCENHKVHNEYDMSSEFEEFERHLEGLEEEMEDFDAEFEDLNAELEGELPVIQSIELTDIRVRTAVLSKNEMIALLCLKTASQGGVICRVDPREPAPAVQPYDDPGEAEHKFSEFLRTSLGNGWRIVYDGLPLKG